MTLLLLHVGSLLVITAVSNFLHNKRNEKICKSIIVQYSLLNTQKIASAS